MILMQTFSRLFLAVGIRSATQIISDWVSAGWTTLYLRPGWEMNGNWENWSVTSGNAADFASAFAHIYTLAHNVSGAKVTVSVEIPMAAAQSI